MRFKFCLILFQKFSICLKKLAIVDNTLKDLGNPNIYEKMHMWSKGIIITWIMYSIIINFYESSFWQSREETASWRLYLPYILNYSLHINTLVDLLFIFLLWFV